MDSLHSRCPPADATQQREGNAPHCISKLLDHFGQMFSRRPCPRSENEARVMRQLVNSIECEPLKQGETEEQAGVVYRGVEQQPGKQSQCSQWSRGIIVALVLTFLSLGINYVMWLTNAYDNAVLKLVSIRDDIDTVFESWKMPPTKAHFSVYFFNYTNPEATVLGNEVPNVQEVGPYVFREQMERIKVHFNDNDTVSFQEQRTIVHVPELSATSLNVTINTPNVLFIVAISKLGNEHFALNFGEQHILNLGSKLQNYDALQLFTNVSIYKALWGYQDGFVNAMAILKNETPEFGFLAKRRGVHHDIITMKTGADDLNQLGVITRWNGKSKIGVWGNTTCDEFRGSDGTQFPAKSVQEGKPLYIYNHGMCRRIPIVFNKTTVSKDGFPAQQYNVFDKMFNMSYEDNSCFVKSEYPTIDGVANTAPCHDGVPLYASFPHLWKGSEEIQKHVSGLKPDPEKHSSYFHIHKDLGISLRAKTRFQLNIMVSRYNYMAFSKQLKQEQTIFPIGWMDYDSGDLPPHFVNSVYHLTYTVKTVKEVLKWTFLLVFIISLAFVCYLKARSINKYPITR